MILDNYLHVALETNEKLLIYRPDSNEDIMRGHSKQGVSGQVMLLTTMIRMLAGDV